MVVLVVATAFVVGYVVFDLEGNVVPSEPRPEASFRFAYDASTETLVVTHYGGDNLDADRVRLVDQGFETVGNFSTGETVSAGESATLEGVDADDSVYVLWATDDGEYVVLASWNARDGNAGTASPAGTAAGHGLGVDAAGTDSGASAAASPASERTASFLLRME